MVTTCILQVGVGDNKHLAVYITKIENYPTEEVLKNPLSWSLWKCEKMVILMQKALVGLYSLSILNPSQSALFTESILD